MDESTGALKSPGVLLALLLGALWLLSAVLFLAVFPEARAKGLSLFAWSQIVLAAFAVVLSCAATSILQRWERK